MKTEVTRTRWNFNALLGWFSLLIGLLGAFLQLKIGVQPIVWLSVFGVVGGGIIISVSGPIKMVTTKMVELRPSDEDDDSN